MISTYDIQTWPRLFPARSSSRFRCLVFVRLLILDNIITNFEDDSSVKSNYKKLNCWHDRNSSMLRV